MSSWYAIGRGPLTQPRDLVAAGVATIMEARLSPWLSYVAIFGVCLIASGVYIVTELYVGFRPDQGKALLNCLRNWRDTRTDQVIIIVSLVLGFWLIGKSVFLLVT